MPILKSSLRPRQQGGISPFNRAVLRLALVTLSIVLVISIAAWLWSIGWPQQQMHRVNRAAYNLTKSAGFTVDEVIVEGRSSIPRADLLRALDAQRGTALFAFDPDKALETIKQLPWVADASVERRLPNRIYLNIYERQPLARWQNIGQTHVIDQAGSVLAQADPAQFGKLPLVIGKGAGERALELLQLLARYPDINPLVRSATRISDRRWDLELTDAIVVQLPEYKAEAALTRLAKLIKEQKILQRNIVGIDLRQPDRVTLKTPDPVAPPPKPTEEPKI